MNNVSTITESKNAAQSGITERRAPAYVKLVYIHPEDGATVELVLNWNRYEDRQRAVATFSWAAYAKVEIRFRTV